MTSVAPTDLKIKIGNERLIKVTGNASRRLRSLLEKQGRPQGALRVAVIGGGCSGLQYKMDLVDGPAPRDILVLSSNVRVVIDPKSALFVSGSLLDFSEDLQKGGFKVTNPNAVAHCSCGESFAAWLIISRFFDNRASPISMIAQSSKLFTNAPACCIRMLLGQTRATSSPS